MKKILLILSVILVVSINYVAVGQQKAQQTSSKYKAEDRKPENISPDKDWILIGAFVAFNGDYMYYAYYNQRTVVQSGTTVKVWIKDVPFSSQTDVARIKLISKRMEGELPTKGYEFYSHSLTLYETDCKARKTRIISGVDYDIDGQRLDGQEVERITELKNIVPDSVGDHMFSKICQDINNR